MQRVSDAKTYLRENFGKGVSCPCCGQFVKQYKRKIYSTMACMLISLYKLDSEEFHHIQTIALQGGNGHPGDFAKLIYWGLIEEKTNEDDHKRTSGFWRITPEGIEFVLGKTTVVNYALLYDGKFMGHEGELVDIRDCLGMKFSYDELMVI